MREKWKHRVLLLTAGLGLGALVLRWAGYRFAMEGAGLPISGHPLIVLLGAVTVAAVGVSLGVPWKLDGSGTLEDNLVPGIPDFLGHWAAGTGIAMTVLLNRPMLEGNLGNLWKITGILAALGAFAAGFFRLSGKRPAFLLHGVICFFFCIHLVNHYQYWCAMPQFYDYGYALFAIVVTCLFSYHRTALDEDICRRRRLLGTGLLSLFLCLSEVAVSRYPWLHLGCGIWAGMTVFCMKPPVPKPVQPASEEKAEKKEG